MGPYNLVVNPDGTYGKNDMMNNPYFIANEVNNPFPETGCMAMPRIDWQIVPGLSFMARYTHDQYDEERETKIAPSYSQEPNGFYGIVNMFRREQNTDFLLSYKNGGDFSVSASAGGNYMNQYVSNVTTQSKMRGTGLIVPNIYSVSNIAPDNLTYSSGYAEGDLQPIRFGLLWIQRCRLSGSYSQK